MCAPEDLNGLPRFVNGKAEFQPFSIFPLSGQEPLPGKSGWLLFLDEFNSAPRSIQAAAYKLILDRCVGNHKLSDKVHIVTAGNYTTDVAITTQMSSAMQSRLISIEIIHCLDDWLKNVAYEQQYDTRLIAFMQFSPESLMRFDSDAYAKKPKPFSCPRSWEFVNKIITGENSLQHLLPLILGAVDENDGYAFYQFASNYDKIPNVRDILDSKDVDVPVESSLQTATMMMLTSYVNQDNFSAIKRYVAKFPVSMRVLFLKALKRKNESIVSSDHYKQMAIELRNILK